MGGTNDIGRFLQVGQAGKGRKLEIHCQAKRSGQITDFRVAFDNGLSEGAFPRLSRRLRIGVVGGGRIAVTQAMAARLSDRWEVMAGALSADPQIAKTRGAEWYLPEERCYSSYKEMADVEAQRPDGIDAVMITTPNHVHYDAARTFLKAGIDVLCDKPLTNVFSEAADLVRLTRETGLVFGVCYTMAFKVMVGRCKFTDPERVLTHQAVEK